MITRDEFLEVSPPFYFIRVENEEWARIHRDMITRWIDAHCGGWSYAEEPTYVFERIGDRLMFKLWLSGDPFADREGEIVAP